MKAYFTASVAGKKINEDKYLLVTDALKGNGITVFSDHIFKRTLDQVMQESKEDRVAFEKEMHRMISESDFLVAETSFPSTSVGYEVSLAQRLGKTVLLLYSEADPPSLLAQPADEKLVCESYTKNNLESIIDDFINFVKGTHDIRFTFFITPQIGQFLDKIARQKKIPKSVYLRNLIEKEMKD
ncbi:MAG: Nucleoside 2-deoxyribosyltransferase [Microgenomates group bacterium GW2011_GWC1_41_8]|uniref:Nucleoside 2-deoxyribosyltransferase n=3 Tax=Microgenomates group TaxID=1794810 RepID=A0A0G0W9A7_9BACT|nr:MAG: Nucleoside 2-deoxyribosyltransferase [Candidatus Roizmanbacteria bacterium GW2011_GWB1_40_7]KKR93864.1 MAG: Nucleoside 2-deoxyribosyltransferase [Candidatus Roizmanbacteria bacterium GW2011_GWA1_41_13]KKS23462.1 MAG: Nucleoside 2-deoxyribosyltransferase [Microgenomates group bacterium GW2011_GWC1_41_8]KKS45301.1 MAG: Nucleoside 2-deoxyribosyltransferase [Candidatus Gottesmanbacteria bacterium GW2011_GWA2_42_18]